MGLAAIQSSSSSAAAVSKPHSSNTFYVNNKQSASDDGAVASVQQILPNASPEHRLIFDASDSRRALNDWELEDYVLVATIEGSLYALDRYSGATRWVLKGNGAAVQSIANIANITKDPWTTKEPQPPRWIVQPVEGGQLFLFDPQFGVLVYVFVGGG
jgi:hypothetical protein